MKKITGYVLTFIGAFIAGLFIAATSHEIKARLEQQRTVASLTNLDTQDKL